MKRRPLWLQLAPNPRQILRLVMGMEAETRRFYQDAANHAPSEEVRALLTDLAEAEEDHQDLLVAETRAKKQSVFPRSKSRSGEIGFMPARVVVAKFFAGAISIGGGCSLGREGPTVHIAGALASNIAGWLGIAKQGRRPALLSGAAAGLAAALNTPLSAITFVLEEIIEDLNNRGFLAQVLIASVTATFVCHIFLGEDPAFVIPSIGHFSSILYVLVIPAEGFAALAGVAFQKGTLTWRDKIKRIKGIPFFLKPAVGATIGIALTDISGVVLHSTMEDECRVKNRVR